MTAAGIATRDPPDGAGFPRLLQVVLDTTDARGLAEFYRRLLGLGYRSGDEPPPPGQDDPRARDWLVLCDESGSRAIAIQRVDHVPKPTWPSPDVPQQLHLDFVVSTRGQLDALHPWVLSPGASLLDDRSDDEAEPLRVYADPAGHPFCIFVHTTEEGAHRDGD